jgi:hypothetical protein
LANSRRTVGFLQACKISQLNIGEAVVDGFDQFQGQNKVVKQWKDYRYLSNQGHWGCSSWHEVVLVALDAPFPTSSRNDSSELIVATYFAANQSRREYFIDIHSWSDFIINNSLTTLFTSMHSFTGLGDVDIPLFRGVLNFQFNIFRN